MQLMKIATFLKIWTNQSFSAYCCQKLKKDHTRIIVYAKYNKHFVSMAPTHWIYPIKNLSLWTQWINPAIRSLYPIFWLGSHVNDYFRICQLVNMVLALRANRKGGCKRFGVSGMVPKPTFWFLGRLKTSVLPSLIIWTTTGGFVAHVSKMPRKVAFKINAAVLTTAPSFFSVPTLPRIRLLDMGKMVSNRFFQPLKWTKICFLILSTCETT